MQDAISSCIKCHLHGVNRGKGKHLDTSDWPSHLLYLSIWAPKNRILKLQVCTLYIAACNVQSVGLCRAVEPYELLAWPAQLRRAVKCEIC